MSIITPKQPPNNHKEGQNNNCKVLHLNISAGHIKHADYKHLHYKTEGLMTIQLYEGMRNRH